MRLTEQQGKTILAELYAAVTRNVRARLPEVLFGTAGGIDVEACGPDRIARQLVDPVAGPPAYR